jgi:hypothetical protein
MAAVLCFLPILGGNAIAQTAVVPVPSQFASAHTVFLSQDGAPALGGKAKLVSNMIYESMYRSLAASKLYTLTGSPADAELTMAVSVLITVGTSNNNFNNISVRLVVRDRKTQALLWTFDEPLDGAFREKTFQHNVDTASGRIADDLKALSQGEEPKP